MKFIQIIGLVVCFHYFSNAQNAEWIRVIENDKNNWITSSTSNNRNKLLFGGTFSGSLTFDTTVLISSGSSDGYVSIINKNGDFIRTISWGGTQFDNTNAIEIVDDAIFMIGNTSSSSYELLGNSYQNQNAGNEIFLARIDTSLNEVIWIESAFSQGSLNFNTSMSADDQFINISGFYGAFQTLTYNLDGEMLWIKEFPTSNSIHSKIHRGNVFVVIDSFDVKNNNGIPIGGVYKHKLIKYNMLGEFQKQVDAFKFVSPQIGNGGGIYKIEVDKNDNVYLIGTFNEPIQFKGDTIDPLGEEKGFIAKFDNSLRPLWLKAVDNNKYQISFHKDNYWITWKEYNVVDSSFYFHLEKYDLNDILKASHQFSSIVGNLEFIENDIYLVGYLDGQIKIHNQTYTNEGFPDFLIIKLEDSITTTIETNSVNENSLKIYPNPASDEISIESIHPIHRIQLFDSLGKLVLQVDNLNLKDYKLNLNKLSAGQYYLLVNNQNGFKLNVSR